MRVHLNNGIYGVIERTLFSVNDLHRFIIQPQPTKVSLCQHEL